MYTMKGADGNDYGPVSEDQMRGWIAEGRANAQTQVKKDEGPWQPLLSYPELSALLGGGGGGSFTASAPAFPGGGMSNNEEAVSDMAFPLSQAAGWMKFVAVVQIISSIPAVFVLVGIVTIWQAVILWKAANRAKEAFASGDASLLTEAVANLKTYFVILGVLWLIGIIFYVIYFFVIFFVIGIGALSGAGAY